MQISGGLKLASRRPARLMQTAAEVQPPLFFAVDRFNCVAVSAEHLPASRDAFRIQLDAALVQWSQAGHRGAWLHIPQTRAELIEIAVAAKFVFHHVDVDRGELALSQWLARDEPNALPPFASSYLGVGALVLNQRGEVIVLTERYGRGPDFWKLPGGAVDRGEDLHAAAAREVREECGIDADFVCLLSLRQLQKYRWQCSDLYFVCLMRARDSSQPLVAQAEEITALRWIPLEDALALPSMKSTAFRMGGTIRREAARLLAGESEADVGGGAVITNPDVDGTVGSLNRIRDCDEGDGMQLVMAPHYFRAEPMTMYICRPDQSAAAVSATQARGAAAL